MGSSSSNSFDGMMGCLAVILLVALAIVVIGMAIRFVSAGC